MKYNLLNKDARKCMFLNTFIGTTFFLIVMGMIYYFNIDKYIEYKLIINITMIIMGVISLINLFISPYFRYKRYKYMIADDKVEVIEGYIFVKRDIVPIKRIHQITIERGPTYYLYNLAKVSLTTAGGVVTINYLKLNEAEAISENLKKIVNEIVE